MVLYSKLTCMCVCVCILYRVFTPSLCVFWATSFLFSNTIIAAVLVVSHPIWSLPFHLLHLFIFFSPELRSIPHTHAHTHARTQSHTYITRSPLSFYYICICIYKIYPIIVCYPVLPFVYYGDYKLTLPSKYHL